MQLFEIIKQTTGLHLVYTVQPEDTLDSVGINMCTHNRISFFAPLVFTQTDNEKYLKYSVASGRTLKAFCTERIRIDSLVRIFCDILQAYSDCEDYMLDAKCILLDPEYIFIDPAGKVSLIYLPVAEHAKTPELAAFLRSVIAGAQFDLFLHGEYVGKIINFLNASAMVSVPDLLAFFKQLKPSPSIQNAAPTSGKDKKTKLPSPRLTPIDSGLKKTDLPPTPGTPPVATPQSASTDVTPAVPEKSISLFYLLQHYNSANAAAYKAQKAQKKQAKNQAPKEKKEKISKKSKTAMPASSSDFAVPGAENPINSSAQPLPAESTPPLTSQSDTSSVRPSVLPADISAFQQDDEQTVIITTELPYLLRKATGEKICLDKSDFLIGRNTRSGTVDYDMSPHMEIGRKHCRILTRGAACYISDCHSQNHTYLNGALLSPDQEVCLQDGDILLLADEEFQFFSH